MSNYICPTCNQPAIDTPGGNPKCGCPVKEVNNTPQKPDKKKMKGFVDGWKHGEALVKNSPEYRLGKVLIEILEEKFVKND